MANNKLQGDTSVKEVEVGAVEAEEPKLISPEPKAKSPTTNPTPPANSTSPFTDALTQAFARGREARERFTNRMAQTIPTTERDRRLSQPPKPHSKFGTGAVKDGELEKINRYKNMDSMALADDDDVGEGDRNAGEYGI